MSIIQRIIVIMGMMLLLLTVGNTEALAAPYEPVAIFKLGSYEYVSYGEIKQMDVQPIIENGRVYLPLRYVLDAIGEEYQSIDYIAKYKIVRITYPDDRHPYNRTYLYKVGEKRVIYSTTEVLYIDDAPILRNERVYLPVKWVVEPREFSVVWDGNKKEVSIWRMGEVPDPDPNYRWWNGYRVRKDTTFDVYGGYYRFGSCEIGLQYDYREFLGKNEKGLYDGLRIHLGGRSYTGFGLRIWNAERDWFDLKLRTSVTKYTPEEDPFTKIRVAK